MLKIKELIKDLINKTSHSVSFMHSYDIEKTLSKKGIKIRKFTSPILAFLTKTDHKAYIDQRNDNNYKGPAIYVANHQVKEDAIMVLKALKKNVYIVFGDNMMFNETLNGLLTFINGGITVKREDVKSRKAALLKTKYILENKGSILYFPEGYLNIKDDGEADKRNRADAHNSEYWLMQEHAGGVYRLAKETGYPIIPVVNLFDDMNEKKCYTRILNLHYIDKNDDYLEAKRKIEEEMVTNLYELMEKYAQYKRHDNGIDFVQKNQELREKNIRELDIKNINWKMSPEDEKLAGKAKVRNPVTTPKEVFSFIENLNINKNNAFLLKNKHNFKRYLKEK